MIIDNKLYDSIYVSKEPYEVDLSYSKNPIGPSPLAMARIEEKKKFVDSYPSYHCDELREKICNREKINANKIIFGAGGDGILQDIVNVLIEKGTNIVLPCLTYTHPIFATIAKGGHAKLADIDDDLSYSWDNIHAQIDNNTRIVFFANPNNPTGLNETAEDILKFVKSISIMVVVDEAIIDYAGESLIKHAGEIENLIVVRSFSKGHGLNGLRIGYAVAHPDIVARTMKIRHPFVNSSLAIEAAGAAIDDDDHVRKSVQCAKDEYIFLKQELEQRGFIVLPSNANCFLTQIPDSIENSTVLCESLKKIGCCVADGTKFFGLGDRYVRIASRKREINQAFLSKLDQILENNRGVDYDTAAKTA